MLTYEETANHFIITEKTLGFHSIKTKTVKYSKDLKTIQINNDPVEDTNKATVEWFNNHYKDKFKCL